MSFWERLASVMAEFDVKAKELSRDSGVSQRHVNAIISGQRPNPKVSTAAAIAAALGVSLDWLVAGEKAAPDALTGDEELFVDLYRQLPEELKALAVQTLLGFVKQTRGSETD